jgi:uncharacterized protein YhfF
MDEAAKDLGVMLPSPKDIFASAEGNGLVTKELNDLALSGKKTATASFPVTNPQYVSTDPFTHVFTNQLHTKAWEYKSWLEIGKVEEGGLSIGLDENNQPFSLMRTTELRVVNFDNVDPTFAAAEGEGDLSLEFYKR